SIVQGDLMRMYVPRSANYVRGRLLSQDVLKVVTATGWRLEQLREILIRYVDFVLDKARVGKDYSLCLNVLISGKFYDLLPQNIIVDELERFHSIDEEWESTDSITLGFIVFRAMVNTLGSVSRLGCTPDEFAPTPI